VKAACDNATVDIPDCMVATEVDQMVDEQSMRMKYQGIEIEQYLQYVGQTMEDFRAGMEPVAKVRVKSNLVIEAISAAEKVEATDEEIDEEAEKVAKQYNMTKEELYARMGGNDSFIREGIVGRKTVELMTAAAKKVACDEHEHEEA